jgi:hypothetical protein
MKRKRIRVSLSRLTVIALGLLVGSTSAARAEGPHAEGHHHKPCSNATLNGSYGYYRTGPILGDGGQLAAVGIFTYDGIGGTVGTESVNRNGDVSLDEGGTGFYLVNPDCTGSLLNQDGEEYSRLVIMNDGATIYLLSENNPVYVVATRIDKN